ncbi:MAG: glycosidase, partial [bacterium]|nr:glycosidase [bacterium]
MKMRLKKWAKNPVLRPEPGNEWEKLAVCNPGAYYDQGKVHLLYRASGETDVYRIYLGLALSDDGFYFERVSREPVYTPRLPFEAGCAEDPRI